MRTADILVHEIAFGGRAFEAVSDKGTEWVRDVLSRNPDYPVFKSGDACMLEFGENSFGIEPCDFQAFTEDMTDCGLVFERAR